MYAVPFLEPHKYAHGKAPRESERRLAWQQPDILAMLNELNTRLWYSSEKISFAPSLGGGSAVVGMTRTPSS